MLEWVYFLLQLPPKSFQVVKIAEMLNCWFLALFVWNCSELKRSYIPSPLSLSPLSPSPSSFFLPPQFPPPPLSYKTPCPSFYPSSSFDDKICKGPKTGYKSPMYKCITSLHRLPSFVCYVLNLEWVVRRMGGW